MIKNTLNKLRIILHEGIPASEYAQEIKALQGYFSNWSVISKDQKSSQSDLDYINSWIGDNCIIVAFLEEVNTDFSKELIQILYNYKANYNTLPYVIFIVRDRTPHKLDDLVQDLVEMTIRYDRRDLEMIALTEPKEDILKQLIKLILKRMSYYNQIGDIYQFPSIPINNHPILRQLLHSEDSLNYSLVDYFKFKNCLNIMVLGKPGTGKSFFINKLLQEKRCREGPESEITKKIIPYCHINYPIRFIDTPRINANSFKSFIKKIFDGQSSEIAVHAAIVLVNVFTRTIVDNDKQLIKMLNDLSIPVYFAITKGQNLERINDFKQMLRTNLIEAFNNELPLDNRIFYIRSTILSTSTCIEGHQELLNEIHTMLKTNFISNYDKTLDKLHNETN